MEVLTHFTLIDSFHRNADNEQFHVHEGILSDHIHLDHQSVEAGCRRSFALFALLQSYKNNF